MNDYEILGYICFVLWVFTGYVNYHLYANSFLHTILNFLIAGFLILAVFSLLGSDWMEQIIKMSFNEFVESHEKELIRDFMNCFKDDYNAFSRQRYNDFVGGREWKISIWVIKQYPIRK